MVSEGYLSRIKFALRTVSIDSNVELEITDIIEECRAKMISLGVDEGVANDEDNYLALGCVRSFARSKFSLDADDQGKNMADFRLQVDELRKAVIDNADS